jgi:hypothetical protein
MAELHPRQEQREEEREHANPGGVVSVDEHAHRVEAVVSSVRTSTIDANKGSSLLTLCMFESGLSRAGHSDDEQHRIPVRGSRHVSSAR